RNRPSRILFHRCQREDRLRQPDKIAKDDFRELARTQMPSARSLGFRRLNNSAEPPRGAARSASSRRPASSAQCLEQLTALGAAPTGASIPARARLILF